MIAYYEVTESIGQFLQSDPEVNTVVIGGFDDVDVDKQSIYAIGHILINSSTFNGGVVVFNITISVMDVVDERKNNIRDIPDVERWKGVSNKQDVLNTTLSVIERLDNELKQGTLMDNGYELEGQTTAEPFEERYENLLTGWSATYTITIPNTVQNC